MKVVGVDIGGTNTELAVVDLVEGIVKTSSFKTKASPIKPLNAIRKN